MSMLEVEDDILQPLDQLKINFKGRNPFSVCNVFKDYLRDIMKVSTKDVVETDLRWDITGDPATFYGMWAGRRKEDRWSRTLIRILAQGSQSRKDFTGDIKIIIKGTVKTSYEYSNFLQKSFWWFFNLMFYYGQRRRYLELARDNTYEIKEKILKELQIYREE
jgi:hypothetical protein